MTTWQIIKDMSTWTKSVLIIYFIFGFPALPLAVLMLLMRRYIFEDRNMFSMENRLNLIVDSCALMIASTLFGGAMFALLTCGHSFR